MRQSAALYCRVSTADQTCARQERDLKAFAKKAGYKIDGVWKDTGSGANDDRAERKKILALAPARVIDVVLVTELTRWGRSMLDLLREWVRCGIALAPNVLKLAGDVPSHREISHRLGLSKNTIRDIFRHNRAA